MALIVYLFGWAGLAGIGVLLATLSTRFCMKRAVDVYEEELGRERGNRVRESVDIFNIIKFIKVTALELPYFRRLVDMREAELGILHRKNKF
jgi:hypothetical protein